MRKQLLQASLMTALATVSSLALAQPANDTPATTTVQTADHDRGFDDWGLLGLIGLFGLMGRKRHDVVTDNRTTNTAR